MIKLEIELNKETIQEIFEGEKIKFSEKKISELMKIVDYYDGDLKSDLELTLLGLIVELINEKWGE